MTQSFAAKYEEESVAVLRDWGKMTERERSCKQAEHGRVDKQQQDAVQHVHGSDRYGKNYTDPPTVPGWYCPDARLQATHRQPRKQAMPIKLVKTGPQDFYEKIGVNTFRQACCKYATHHFTQHATKRSIYASIANMSGNKHSAVNGEIYAKATPLSRGEDITTNGANFLRHATPQATLK